MIIKKITFNNKGFDTSSKFKSKSLESSGKFIINLL